MKNKFVIKAISVIVSITLAFCAVGSAYAEESTTAPAAESTTQAEPTTQPEITEEEAKKTLEEQRAELEERLKESEEKLKGFEESAKETEEYINALDEKIGYMNEELTLLDSEVASAQKKVAKLEKQIKPLRKELSELQQQFETAKQEFEQLNAEFTDTYNAYCLRLRAMYISGSNSILVALLTSKDIAQFLNRFEMIKAVAKSDTELLQEVNAKMDEILTKQDGLNERKNELNKKKVSLYKKQAEFKKQKATVESKQEEIARKKVILAQDRARSDALFAKYTAQTHIYTEFRNEDEELIASVEAEISDLINGLKAPDEVTTVNTEQHDTSVSTTVNPENALYSNSNAVLNLTYPAPGHYAVSCAFGYYSNGRPHTGIDFPYPVGSKVVAAQKGIVIKVKRLNYSYGYYVMIYHGTDAKGRTVVTLYAHNSSILVSTGQTVSKGQQIAKGGSTGNSTGPHCHFELILDGTKVNAKNYLSK